MTIKKITSDSITIFASRISISLSNILFLPLLTKNLGVTDYGIWVQCWVTIPLLGGLLNMGIPYAFSRYFPTMKKEKYSGDFFAVLLPILVISSLASTIIFLLSPQLSSSLFDGNEEVVRLLALIVLFWSLDYVFFELIRSLGKMKWYGILIVSHNFFELGLGVLFIFIGWGVEGAIAGIMIVRAFLVLVFLILIRKVIIYKRPDFINFRKYANYGVPLLPQDISSWVLSSFDRYMISIIIGTSAVGLYNPGYIVGQSVPLHLVTVFAITLTPTLSKMYDEGKIEDIIVSLTLMLKSFLLIILPFLFGSLVLSYPLLTFLSTEEIAKESLNIVPLVVLGLIFYGLKVIVSQNLLLEKKTKLIGFSYVISAAVNILINIILLPWIGIIGAAISTLVAYLSDFLITYNWTNKNILPSLQMHQISKIFLSSIVMCIFTYAIYNYFPFYSALLSLAVSIVVYFMAIMKLKVYSEEELIIVKELFPVLEQIKKIAHL